VMSRGWLFTIARLGRASRELVEHSKGKDVHSVVTIPRFLCGSPRPCRLRTMLFWPQWKALSSVLTTCRVFMGPDKPSSFCNCLVEPHLLASCGAFTFGGRMRPRAKTSSREQGPDFDLVGTCEWLSYMRAFGRQTYGVLVRFFPCRVYIDSSRHYTLGYE
jgi:hypothetical protein